MSIASRGPARPESWRSPLRGGWLTAVFALVVLVGVTLMFVTGPLPYDPYARTFPATTWLGDQQRVDGIGEALIRSLAV